MTHVGISFSLSPICIARVPAQDEPKRSKRKRQVGKSPQNGHFYFHQPLIFFGSFVFLSSTFLLLSLYLSSSIMTCNQLLLRMMERHTIIEAFYGALKLFLSLQAYDLSGIRIVAQRTRIICKCGRGESFIERASFSPFGESEHACMLRMKEYGCMDCALHFFRRHISDYFDRLLSLLIPIHAARKY